MTDEALTEEEKVEQRLGKPIYDIMRCHDGATRAVRVIDGVKVDPTLPKESELSNKKDAQKKSQPKSHSRKKVIAFRKSTGIKKHQLTTKPPDRRQHEVSQ